MDGIIVKIKIYNYFKTVVNYTLRLRRCSIDKSNGEIIFNIVHEV
jgi:hypothetical protein